MTRKEKDFIKISKVLGQSKVIGSLSVWQIMPLGLAILLIGGLCWLKVNIFQAIIIGAWILGAIVMVTGGRPDRIMRRFLGKPKRWQRGFYPARPLLEKETEK